MTPFLKWAGGKRWLISKSEDLFPDNTSFNRYFEPFLGGGAVFFHIKPTTGFLSDINPDLINSYVAIRDDWQALLEILSKYDRQHSNDFYYKIRDSKPRSSLQKAARFIYLNRTCWNGLYRVNKKGQFNVPIGTKTKVILPEDNFEELSKSLNKVNIEACDFEVTIDKACSGDFIFVDPPYTVKHNLNGFVKYNENIFSWDDQVRLRDSLVRANQRGASIVILNANHMSIRKLYKDFGEMITLNRASVIAASSEFRGIYSELAIKCW